ncbi:MAG: tyrosine-protein phosphatase [Mycobacteriaceae bacterium]|nr:tyrosine-protein phosphatase [Mycobacteriaceae bacterium]
MRTAAAVAALSACFAVTAAGQLAAAPAAAPVSLHLASVANARDIGGYRTVDGRVVRTGLVIRSDALTDAAPADLARLTALHVRTVDDLRTGVERALQPERLPAGAIGLWRDVLGQAPITTVVAPQTAYGVFVTDPNARGAIAAVLRDIAAADGALLYHCTAGKDRTGWTTAVLLTLLGVDRATVTRDFMASNAFLQAAANDPMRGVTLDELNTAFDTVAAQYGSFDNYARAGLGLTDRDISALERKLLA